jgi:Sortase domain
VPARWPGGVAERSRSLLLPATALLAGLLLILGGVGLLELSGSTSASAPVVPTVDYGSLASASATSATLRPPVAASVPVGSRLMLPRLGVDAVVTVVGAPGGVMAVPRDPTELGWWDGGAAPGQTRGNVVVVGHVNYAGSSGALAVLVDTRIGDDVRITEPGRVYRYRIRAVRTYAKTTGLPAAIFSRSGPGGLVLITCGGPFDPATGNYLDNIVAYADPL